MKPEVWLARHIYRPQRSSQACVILFTGWVSGPGGSPIFRGGVWCRRSQIFWGVSNFRGGGIWAQGVSKFFGDLQFLGGLQIFFSFFSIFFPKLSSDMHQPPPSPDGQCTSGTHPTIGCMLGCSTVHT